MRHNLINNEKAGSCRGLFLGCCLELSDAFGTVARRQPLSGLVRVSAKESFILAGRRVGLIEAKKQKPETAWETRLPSLVAIDNQGQQGTIHSIRPSAPQRSRVGRV